MQHDIAEPRIAGRCRIVVHDEHQVGKTAREMLSDRNPEVLPATRRGVAVAAIPHDLRAIQGKVMRRTGRRLAIVETNRMHLTLSRAPVVELDHRVRGNRVRICQPLPGVALQVQRRTTVLDHRAA